jgi:hypothetical protein
MLLQFILCRLLLVEEFSCRDLHVEVYFNVGAKDISDLEHSSVSKMFSL